jgi:PLAT/LH2 domain
MKRLLGALAALTLLFAAPAHAYEEDTHFTMTLVLCRAAGLTDAEALTVASYDQGMDDSDGTVANGGVGGIIPNIPEESFWHAIPKSGTKTEVLARKKELWDSVVAEKDATKRLQRLGVFFHYQQDTWAHRKHPNSDPATFDTYSTPFGHAADGHQPDRPPFDPICALRCLEEGSAYARIFVKDCLRRTPTPLFDNYSAAKGELDSAWTDKRKGKFFNTLVIDSSTPARKFFTDLIRSQIGAYTVSTDANPKFLFRETADEAKYAAIKEALEGVCSRAGVAVRIPVVRTKITNLTTSQFQGSNLGTTTYSVKIYTGDVSGAGTDSNIFLSFKGANGQIGEQRLNALITTNAFERNQTDYVTLVNLAPVGELVSVTVRSDNMYPASAWYLGWIEISAPGIATRRFTFNKWIESPNLSATSPSPSAPVATGPLKIKIKSASNQMYVCASDGLQHNKWLYCKAGTPLTFVVEGDLNNCSLRVDGTQLYFSYNETTGAVKLWNTKDKAQFKLERQSNGTYAMRNIAFDQYVWLSKESPYITRAGNAAISSGRWTIEGLP